MIGGFLSNWLEIETDRFDSTHSALYCFGSMILLTLFILDKITSAMTWSGIGFISRITTSCFSFMKVDASQKAFSNNFLGEIDPEALEQEYACTKQLMEEKRI